MTGRRPGGDAARETPADRNPDALLARPQPVVARLLEITGADRLLDMRELAGLTGGESRVEHECDLHRRRRLLAASVRGGWAVFIWLGTR